eukprot:scaffold40248_cov72-Phaeocystis_antarctica.AAC.1
MQGRYPYRRQALTRCRGALTHRALAGSLVRVKAARVKGEDDGAPLGGLVSATRALGEGDGASFDGRVSAKASSNSGKGDGEPWGRPGSLPCPPLALEPGLRGHAADCDDADAEHSPCWPLVDAKPDKATKFARHRRGDRQTDRQTEKRTAKPRTTKLV